MKATSFWIRYSVYKYLFLSRSNAPAWECTWEFFVQQNLQKIKLPASEEVRSFDGLLRATLRNVAFAVGKNRYNIPTQERGNEHIGELVELGNNQTRLAMHCELRLIEYNE